MVKTTHIQTFETENNKNLIVQVKDVTFSYPADYFAPQYWLERIKMQKTKQNISVLSGISFSVPVGQITALLGASGCGKTTLLKLILGLLEPKSGQVTVLGSTPGSQASSVPGPSVGYLPQQIAMPDGRFTTTELLTYFGRLRGMSPKVIASQISHLLQLLELPPKGDARPFALLSGGQQRRVSLAAALLNSPPLLVLDEPTVGLDPLLREIIWRHLRKLCREVGVSVVITTHYIEEARSADQVALMRSGVLLAEEPPDCLLQKYQCSNLEEVFLRLSITQDEVCSKLEVLPKHKEEKKNLKLAPKPSILDCSNLFRLYRLRALLAKNLAYYSQNPLATLLFLTVPTALLCLSLHVFHSSPKNLPIAVVNEEMEVLTTNNFTAANLTSSFFYRQNFKSLKLVNVSSVDEAVNQILNGKALAAVHFYGNFSAALESRHKMLLSTNQTTIDSSSAHLYLDLSNIILGSTALVHLLQGFAGSLQDYFRSVGQNPRAFALPITVQEVVYGSLNISRLTDSMVPGFMLLYVFFINAAGSALHLVQERKSGLFERIQASGVTLFELQLSHFLVQLLFVLVQSVPLFGYLIFSGSFQTEGAYVDILAIYLLEGVAGVVYGLLLSVLFEEAFFVLCSLMGGVVTLVVLGDVFWPVEFIPVVFYRFAEVVFPVTVSLKATKAVVYRGWALTKAAVLVDGVVVPLLWTVACLGLTVAIVEMRGRLVK